MRYVVSDPTATD